ncbi:Ger(x)C family spore germination protein [Pseudalkalibacillus sp. A8]|uniref:Ger(x)C family spore germination protein n=1 Tax=Pseudalkalibacillus sp. A8 TaxID=3382641 RepID=UPI0038B4BDF8
MSSRTGKIIIILSSFCLLFILLMGCNRGRVVDDLQILSIMGFGLEDEAYKGTALYSDYTEQKQGKIHLLHGQAKNTRIILEEINQQSPKPIEVGKLHMLIFSRNLAEDGIAHFIKTICRDPLINSNLIVAVSDEPVENIMTKEGSESLPDLLQNNFKSGNVPFSNLHLLLYDYYGEGRDVSIPFINLNQNGKVEVNRYAIFKKDRLSLVLNQKEMILYKILKGESMKGQMEVEVRKGPQKGLTVLKSLSGKKIETIYQSGQKIKYRITLDGMVKEYPEWLNLRKKEDVKILTKELEKNLMKDLSNLLSTFQDHGVDPLGAGDLVRTHSKRWNEAEFYENIYQQIEFDIDLRIQLQTSGIGE